MIELTFPKEFFNAEDTLSCGQLFRYTSKDNGFYVYSADKCCFVFENNNNTVISCEDIDKDYFLNYFDLSRDYKKIFDTAQNSKYDIIKKASLLGKGIRLLNQNKTETLFSFIISQNNNIPRIKGIIEKLCLYLGEKKYFNGDAYYTFPTPLKMSQQSLEFYKKIGLGYRAEYIKKLADDIINGFSVDCLEKENTENLKNKLLLIFGVGPKVADCVTLFGYKRSDSFPVDTWIEKVYTENFNGTLKDRKKIARFFVDEFGDNSGYFQQYLFYYKRSLENK